MLLSLLLPFFFALTRTGISFLFRRMCWWCWCFSEKKTCACASRTNLSFFEKRYREFETCPCRGVSVFFSEFSDMFRMWKNDASRDCHFPASCDQASSEHAALAAKTWKLSWAFRVADSTWKFPEERFMVEAFQLFWGGGFFGWKFTFCQVDLDLWKSWWFFLRIPNHGIHHHGMETTTGWWFHCFFNFHPYLGGR